MADGAFHWELIDHRLVGLKLTDLAEEMQEGIRVEIEQIRFDNIGNSNSQTVPSQIIAMQLRRADEWAEETYKAYCEVWAKQGYEKTAAFIRAVSSHGISLIVSARTNAVISQLSAERARTAAPIEPHNARIGDFKRSMIRLAARWTRRLEIEARECEHSERTSRSKQQNTSDQRENLKEAIAGRKTEIERINRNLDNLPAPGSPSRFGQPLRVSQQAVGKLIRQRQEHESALAELEREASRLTALVGETSAGETPDSEQTSWGAPQPIQTPQKPPLSRKPYRSLYEGLKPEMKVVDFSSAMLAANLTDKQYDCYSLAREYQRPMKEVEQRMTLTRKTIHEHIAAAERAMKKLSLKEYRAKNAAKHKRPE